MTDRYYDAGPGVNDPDPRHPESAGLHNDGTDTAEQIPGLPGIDDHFIDLANGGIQPPGFLQFFLLCFSLPGVTAVDYAVQKDQEYPRAGRCKNKDVGDLPAQGRVFAACRQEEFEVVIAG